VSIKLEGIEELKRLIEKALLNHKENEVRKVMAKGAKLLVEEAKRNVAGNDSVDSGVLRDSIQILPKWKGDPLGIYVGPRIKRRRRKKGETGKISDSPFYAAWVEYGTNPHNLGYKGKFVSGKGASHPGARKKPYMRPAYDTQGQAALNAAIDELKKLIESKVR
jgi:HK97 gp10 family phage protein